MVVNSEKGYVLWLAVSSHRTGGEEFYYFSFTFSSVSIIFVYVFSYNCLVNVC